jgi:hypothetical protein
MLDIRFEIAGRKLDPCFVGDSVQKATLLHAYHVIKQKFRPIRIPDKEEPLRVMITGEDVAHLRWELHGSQETLRQVREKLGDVQSGQILAAAAA